MRRLIRIVPFYWAATLGLFTLALMYPHLMRSTQPDVTQLIFSLFFIPRETTYAGLFPTLILGWSLNYEVYFYALFAGALVLSRRWAPVLTVVALSAVWLGITMSGTTTPSVLFYARPIVFEFAFGIAAFYVFQAARDRAAALRRNQSLRRLTWTLAIAAPIVLCISESQHGFGLPRFVSAGIPAFFLVVALLVLEQIYGIKAKHRLIHLLGESSFILYLLHPYIIYGALRTIFRGHAEWPMVAHVGAVLGLLSVSAAVAIAIHIGFEKPAMAWLRARLLPADKAPAARARGQTPRATAGVAMAGTLASESISAFDLALSASSGPVIKAPRHPGEPARSSRGKALPREGRARTTLTPAADAHDAA